MKNGWTAFVCVSLRLESCSRKALEKQFLRGLVHKFFFFLSHARDCTTFTLRDLTDFLRKEGESALY